nr:GNAT family N-acetyltransferase [Anaerolineae bacterium]
MEMSSFASRLEFREGIEQDWPAVQAITARTWGGEDYLNQDLWSAWINDSTGALHVATFNQHVVGFGKVACLGPAEWWLEGLRVHPDVQGKGVARAIMAENMAWFSRHGDGIIRFATCSENEATGHLAREYKFRNTVSYVNVEAPTAQHEYHGFKLLEPQNADLVWNYLRRSPVYRVDHYVESLWKLYYLTRDRLETYLGDSSVDVLGWRQHDQLSGVAVIYNQSPEPALQLDANKLYIGYLDAPDDTTLGAMLGALRGLAEARGYGHATWKMPKGIGAERVVGGSGFEITWPDDEEIRLYERPLNV